MDVQTDATWSRNRAGSTCRSILVSEVAHPGRCQKAKPSANSENISVINRSRPALRIRRISANSPRPSDGRDQLQNTLLREPVQRRVDLPRHQLDDDPGFSIIGFATNDAARQRERSMRIAGVELHLGTQDAEPLIGIENTGLRQRPLRGSCLCGSQAVVMRAEQIGHGLCVMGRAKREPEPCAGQYGNRDENKSNRRHSDNDRRSAARFAPRSRCGLAQR